MILAPLLLAAQLSAAVPGPGADQEIVIIAERLRAVKFKMKRDSKTLLGTCRITHSSGDPALDSLACAAAVECMGPQKITGAAWNDCMRPKWQSIVAQRREQMRAARKAG